MTYFQVIWSKQSTSKMNIIANLVQFITKYFLPWMAHVYQYFSKYKMLGSKYKKASYLNCLRSTVTIISNPSASEWVGDSLSLSVFSDRGHRGPYSPYKPCNHNIYIGIIIFPDIDVHNLQVILNLKKINKNKHKRWGLVIGNNHSTSIYYNSSDLTNILAEIEPNTAITH